MLASSQENLCETGMFPWNYLKLVELHFLMENFHRISQPGLQQVLSLSYSFHVWVDFACLFFVPEDTK